MVDLPSRRSLIAGFAGGAAVCAAGSGQAQSTAGRFGATLEEDLRTYIGFGSKASGGLGDEACGAWLEARLQALGFATERQRFSVPFYTSEARLHLDDDVTPLWVVPDVRARAAPNIEVVGPLVLADGAGEVPAGAIALTSLPSRRWSSLDAPEIRSAVARADGAGARALVLVTTGYSGEAAALNLKADEALPLPVATAGDGNRPLVAAAQAGRTARLVIAGQAGDRPAFNLIGKRPGHGEGRLVLSTPRSGWFACAAERGTGLAAWLAVIESLTAYPGPIELVCTSGHEWEGAGAHAYLDAHAPAPGDVRLWAHFGANFASRDANLLARRPIWLSTADSQRFLMTPPDHLDSARALFAGQPGLADPFPLTDRAAGELGVLIQRGYRSTIGIFGAPRLHHTPADLEDGVSAPLVRQSAQAMAALIRQIAT